MTWMKLLNAYIRPQIPHSVRLTVRMSKNVKLDGEQVIVLR